MIRLLLEFFLALVLFLVIYLVFSGVMKELLFIVDRYIAGGLI